MRDFWMKADVEGRSTSLSGGPRKTGGKMDIDILAKVEGSSVKALNIRCYTNEDGELVVRVVSSMPGNNQVTAQTDKNVNTMIYPQRSVENG